MSTSTPQDLGDIVQNLANRVHAVEQQATTPENFPVGGNEFEEIIVGPEGDQVVINRNVDAPTNLMVTAGYYLNDSYVDVDWDPPASGNFEHFEVVLSVKEPGGIYVPERTTRVVDSSARISGLTPNTTYGIRVRSVNRIGDRSNSVPAVGWEDFVSERDQTVPPAPTNPSLLASLRTVVASWDESSEPDVQLSRGLYEVQVDRAPYFDSGPFGEPDRSARVAATVAVFDGLEPNTEYYMRVRAIDSSANESAWSTPTISAVTVQAGSSDIASNAIVRDKIAAGEVIAGKLATDSVLANNIKAGEIKTDHLEAGAVNADKIDVLALYVDQYIEGNYIEGETGWRIDGDGTVELNNLLARGIFSSGPSEIHDWWLLIGDDSRVPPVGGIDLESVLYWDIQNPDFSVGPFIAPGWASNPDEAINDTQILVMSGGLIEESNRWNESSFIAFIGPLTPSDPTFEWKSSGELLIQGIDKTRITARSDPYNTTQLSVAEIKLESENNIVLTTRQYTNHDGSISINSSRYITLSADIDVRLYSDGDIRLIPTGLVDVIGGFRAETVQFANHYVHQSAFYDWSHYPIGLSAFPVSGTGGDWPGHGVVLTMNFSSTRFGQIFIGKNSGAMYRGLVNNGPSLAPWKSF